MKEDELWKVYTFDKNIDDHYKLYFSKYGEVMSYSRNNPEGRLIKGSLREGYPIISFTQYKQISQEARDNFQNQERIIASLRSEARDLKKIIRKKSSTGKEIITAQKRLQELAKEIKKSVDRLSRQRKKDLKSRAVYFHLLVHKAVAELFIPNDDPESKPFVIHKNFDKSDNRVENLTWATREEVVARSFKSPKFIAYKINSPRKTPTAVAKLSRNDVVLIKRKLQRGEPMARLARRFGVSDMQIYRIKTGENWGDVATSLLKDKT